MLEVHRSAKDHSPVLQSELLAEQTSNGGYGIERTFFPLRIGMIPGNGKLRESPRPPLPPHTQRVHVGIWYILRAQRGSHIPTLRPKYIPYTYMDPLGQVCRNLIGRPGLFRIPYLFEEGCGVGLNNPNPKLLKSCMILGTLSRELWYSSVQGHAGFLASTIVSPKPSVWARNSCM